MIVLTAEQVSHLLWRDQFPDAHLRPLVLTDGRYGVSENVLNDPRHARWHSLLRQGSVVPNSSVTVENTGHQSNFWIQVDGKRMDLGLASYCDPARAFNYPQRGSFDVVSPGLYRFCCQYNNDHASYDWGNNRRRVELTQPDSSGPKMGDTYWCSWSTILTDQRAGLQGPNGSLLHQWFKTPVSGDVAGQYGPFLYVVLDSGKLTIATRSSADAYPADNKHVVEDFSPATGTPTHFVISGKLGNPGLLNVWINGVHKVANVSIPLGFYGAPTPDNPAYMHTAWGMYQANITAVDVLYHANIEFGTADLSARITDPLPVTAPPGGWV